MHRLFAAGLEDYGAMGAVTAAVVALASWLVRHVMVAREDDIAAARRQLDAQAADYREAIKTQADAYVATSREQAAALKEQAAAFLAASKEQEARADRRHEALVQHHDRRHAELVGRLDDTDGALARLAHAAGLKKALEDHDQQQARRRAGGNSSP